MTCDRWCASTGWSFRSIVRKYRAANWPRHGRKLSPHVYCCSASVLSSISSCLNTCIDTWPVSVTNQWHYITGVRVVERKRLHHWSVWRSDNRCHHAWRSSTAEVMSHSLPEFLPLTVSCHPHTQIVLDLAHVAIEGGVLWKVRESLLAAVQSGQAKIASLYPQTCRDWDFCSD